MYRSRLGEQEPKPVFRVVTSAGEAEEHLRVIRQAMERSTKHSTLSGLSGIVVGILALGGCLVTMTVVRDSSFASPSPAWKFWFVGVWATVLALSIFTDIVLTKRRAARVGKTAFSPVGRHLTRAAAPGFVAVLAASLFYTLHPNLIGAYLYGIWMLCYATSLLSVGLFSVREVSVLGWAFLAAGFVTLLLPYGDWARVMMAVTFGGFHIVYGVWMGRKYGW